MVLCGSHSVNYTLAMAMIDPRDYAVIGVVLLAFVVATLHWINYVQ